MLKTICSTRDVNRIAALRLKLLQFTSYDSASDLREVMKLSGYATPEGTLHYRDRFYDRAAGNHFRNQHGLLLSSIGIGTYLGNPDPATDKSYEESVVRAVQTGLNVIDSAANYRFQRSERSIGAALKRLVNDFGLSRNELFVCTKGGYLPFDGSAPRDVRAYVEETFVKTGIASFADIVGGSHCMTPSYLQSQLDQSLDNLSLDCIDVYYIHNPESQLSYVGESEFYHGLKRAFEILEKNRQENKIRWYGVATWNGFRVPENSSGYHSLPRMVALAGEIAGDSHGFRFVQLPYNLAMTEALTLPNQTVAGKTMSLLEAASSLGITAIASASLLQGRVAQRLPEQIRSALGSQRTDAQTALQFVRSTPGVTTALVGMSNIEHVDENLELIGIEPVEERVVQLMS